MPQPEFTVQEAFLVPNETYAGISKGLSIPVTYDGAADYLNPVMRDLQDFGNIHMDMVLPGGSYRFGSGSVSAPSISFAADTDNGFYYIGANNIGFSIGGAKTWDYQSAKTETTLNLLPSASDLDLGSATQRWDLFGQDVNIDTSLTLSFLTAGRVPIVSTGGLILDDSGFLFDATANDVTVDGNYKTKSGTAFTGTLDHAIGADRTWTLPDGSGTIPLWAGDISGGTATAPAIPNDTVTYAKMQNVSAASRLIGRGSAAGAGDPEEISLGSGLSMAGTTLSATATAEDSGNGVLRMERFW